LKGLLLVVVHTTIQFHTASILSFLSFFKNYFYFLFVFFYIDIYISLLFFAF